MSGSCRGGGLEIQRSLGLEVVFYRSQAEV